MALVKLFILQQPKEINISVSVFLDWISYCNQVTYREYSIQDWLEWVNNY